MVILSCGFPPESVASKSFRDFNVEVLFLHWILQLRYALKRFERPFERNLHFLALPMTSVTAFSNLR